MRQKLIITIIFILFLGIGYSQTISIKGVITDKQTKDSIPYATVVVKDTIGNIVIGVLSNINGEYSINLIKPEIYNIEFSFIGYTKQIIKGISIDSNKTQILNVSLGISATTLETVEIKCQRVPIDVSYSACSMTISTMACHSIPSNNRSRRRARKLARKYSNNTNYYDNAILTRTSSNNTESYDSIEENAYKTVMDHPLSTFSIDVDRASYSNTRRYLENNQMPPKDAVRIEELINYFHYDYASPKGDQPFSINLEATVCPWNSEHRIVQIGLKAKELNEEEIPPNNLVFLLDVSGSMSSPNKLPLVKKSMKILIDKLRPQDRVAIVVYAGAAGCVLKSTSGAKKEKIYKAIDQLQSGGSTAGGEGIQLAYKIAKDNFIEKGNNRVILATDGDFNVGLSDDVSLVKMIEKKRKDDVYLTILGFGMGNYKDGKMEQISNAGNGNYAYIDNILEAEKMFSTELWGTIYTIAKDVKIQIEFNPAKIKSYRLIGYENRMLAAEDFNDDEKDAGEIGLGHCVTAIYEVVFTDSSKSNDSNQKIDTLKYQTTNLVASEELLTVKFRYKEPKGKESKLISKSIYLKDIELNQISNNLLLSTSVAEFGLLLRDSKHKGSASYSQVLERAKEAAKYDPYGYRSEFIKLVRISELLN